MQKLVRAINSLKTTQVSSLVEKRLSDFEKMHVTGNREWFCEMCFCLLTANASAEMGLKVQNALGFDGFYSLPEQELSARLRGLGYRFYNRRAEFISLARKHADIKDRVKKFSGEQEARKWLDGNIKGLGLKESSHFLRNVGYKNLAIIDRHVLNILDEHGVHEKPKTVSPKNYFAIEKKLSQICTRTGTTQAELDLYLWYMKTGKVLK